MRAPAGRDATPSSPRMLRVAFSALRVRPSGPPFRVDGGGAAGRGRPGLGGGAAPARWGGWGVGTWNRAWGEGGGTGSATPPSCRGGAAQRARRARHRTQSPPPADPASGSRWPESLSRLPAAAMAQLEPPPMTATIRRRRRRRRHQQGSRGARAPAQRCAGRGRARVGVAPRPRA
jgi:hypothetical protein